MVKHTLIILRHLLQDILKCFCSFWGVCVMHEMIKSSLTTNFSQSTGKAERKDLSFKPVLRSFEFGWQRPVKSK